MTRARVATGTGSLPNVTFFAAGGLASAARTGLVRAANNRGRRVRDSGNIRDGRREDGRSGRGRGSWTGRSGVPILTPETDGIQADFPPIPWADPPSPAGPHPTPPTVPGRNGTPDR